MGAWVAKKRICIEHSKQHRNVENFFHKFNSPACICNMSYLHNYINNKKGENGEQKIVRHTHTYKVVQG